MLIHEINKKLIVFGDKVLASIKYEINSKYSVYELFKLEQDKREALEQKLTKYLYNS